MTAAFSPVVSILLELTEECVEVTLPLGLDPDLRPGVDRSSYKAANKQNGPGNGATLRLVCICPVVALYRLQRLS